MHNAEMQYLRLLPSPWQPDDEHVQVPRRCLRAIKDPHLTRFKVHGAGVDPDRTLLQDQSTLDIELSGRNYSRYKNEE